MTRTGSLMGNSYGIAQAVTAAARRGHLIRLGLVNSLQVYYQTSLLL